MSGRDAIALSCLLGGLLKRHAHGHATKVLEEQLAVRYPFQCFGPVGGGDDDAGKRTSDEQVGGALAQLEPCPNDGREELAFRQPSLIGEIIKRHESPLPCRELVPLGNRRF